MCIGVIQRSSRDGPRLCVFVNSLLKGVKIKTSSCKAKGRKLQQWLRDKLLEIIDTLEPDDVKSTGMGQSGEDIQLSPAARKLIPYTFECKNVEKLNVWAAYDQACEHGKGEPVLVMKKNNRKPLVVIDAEYFLKGLTDE